ncbi:hypothetical protein SDC9_54437 [bioreactor metagenome]|uniref:Uncharacterized protein n=1 Tax=bioreactor metagenome TaxID=1076179 RepID=A0A644WW28_9ZZZZ
MIGINRRQAVEQINLLPVRCGIAKHAQRIQRGNSVLCLRRIVHALRLVDDDDGVRVLYVAHGGFAVQLVLYLIDDVLGLFESVDVDDHDLDVRAGGELPNVGQLGRVIYEKAARHVVILQAEMLLCDFKGFIHALADRNGRNDDNELRKAVLPVQLKDRFGIDVGLTRASLHLDTELAV